MLQSPFLEAKSSFLNRLQFLHWIHSFFLINRGLIREFMCISMLLICTSKDGCTIERIVTTHMPVTLKRMMGALDSNWQPPILTLEHQDMARKETQISSCMCVCVAHLKLGRRPCKREKTCPNEGIMNQNQRERVSTMLISFLALGLAPPCTMHTSWPLICPCGPHSTSL